MSGALLIPACSFGRVFDTDPLQEVLTLSELTAALRRFEIKVATATKIEREVARIQQAAERLRAGETPRGKFMGKLHKAAERARKEGRDPLGEIASNAEALVQESRKSAKRDLRLWSPVLYRPGAPKRGSDHVTHVGCLVLDYDDGTAISEASTTWSTWFHIVYTTWSHTLERPRFRLALPLSFPVPAEDWPKVWSWAEELAHFEIDPAMKSPAATYALPAVPHRAWPREAFSRPGAILDPVDEGILARRTELSLSPRRPAGNVPSAIRGEDPDHDYIDHQDPEAVYFVDEEWVDEEWDEASDWDASPELVAAAAHGPLAGAAETSTAAARSAAVAEPLPADEELPRDIGVQTVLHRVFPPATPLGGEVALGNGPSIEPTIFPAALVLRLEAALLALEENGRASALVDGLERLVALHREGWLTEAELALAKQRVLAEEEPAGDPRHVGPGRHRRTLAVDFDGVLHSYASGWRGPTVISDPPVAGAIEWLTQAAERFDVAVCSVRNAYPGAVEAMRAWLSGHGLEDRVLERVRFPRAKPPAELYVDDRAYRFEGTFPSFEELGALEPWNRPRRR